MLMTPSEWDAALNTTDDPLGLTKGLDLQQPEEARRYLQAATATRDSQLIERALQDVALLPQTRLRGARLMALGQLGQLEHLASAGDTPVPDVSPSTMADACDVATARGIALRALRHYPEAQTQLEIGLFLARLLGLRYREQHLLLELAQLLTVTGQPRPELIEEAMALPLQPSMRRTRYGLGALAEACMGVGDYGRARRLMARETGSQSEIWAFASALLGDPLAQASETEPGMFAELAQAVWSLRSGHEFSLPTMTPDSPEAEYGALLRAVAMLRLRPLAGPGYRLACSLTHLTPDQRVWQLALQAHALALGGGVADLGQVLQAFRTALDGLRTREYILPLLRALMPEAYMLLGLLPYAHPEITDTLAELPILTGECVSYRYQQRKLPGRAAGSAVWVREAATGIPARFSRESRKRVREALAGYGISAVLNLGLCLRVVRQTLGTAGQAERQLWLQALETALDWIDSDVLRRDLRRDLAE
jgi:hypothetical protein